jgi:hypothetical protein
MEDYKVVIPADLPVAVAVLAVLIGVVVVVALIRRERR